MKQRLMLFLRALVVAVPLLCTTGCGGDDPQNPWWLASPWAPLEWIWVPADMVPDNSGTGSSTGG